MHPGISTASLYPEPIEVALRRLIDMGVECVELFLNTPSELEERCLKELRRMADDAGVRIVSVHPFTSMMEPFFFFSSYERRLKDGLELYRSFFNAANLLGASLLVFHGDHRGSHMEQEVMFERLRLLLEEGRRYQVRLAHENVPRCVGNDPAFFRALGAALPEIGFVLDLKQAIRCGYTWQEMLDGMGQNLCHIHLSDHTAAHDCLPFGKGDLDFSVLRNRLVQMNYDGALVIELYRENYGALSELEESYRLLCNCL